MDSENYDEEDEEKLEEGDEESDKESIQNGDEESDPEGEEDLQDKDGTTFLRRKILPSKKIMKVPS